MKNKVVVTIGGKDYTMVAVEDEEYVRRCAALVDQQIQQITQDSRLSQTDAAVLAAMNVADQFLKEQEASENLRRQVKENLEEASALKLELSEAKREIFKLSTRK
ncbi:MAG: cell division protein ZapA [Lawsonibacter sp.]|nr:cell division protein ZapA [Lawsonibacter sp.]